MGIKINQEYETYRKYIKNTLKKSRYIHSVGVSYTAASLAMRYEGNIEKAQVAGILHDIAKGYDYDYLIDKCLESDIPVSDVEKNSPELLHSKYGMVLAKELFNIDDEEILNAIYYHTTGRPSMTLLEKIIFIADFIEPGRTNLPNLSEIRQLSFTDIDKAIALICKSSLDYLQAKGTPIDDATIATYNYYNKLNEGDIL